MMRMLLSSFSYKSTGWELKAMDALKPTNLLVGKNASGKTRTIMALHNVTNFLQMKPAGFVLGVGAFKTKMTFIDLHSSDWKMIYSFESVDGRIASESLEVNGRSLIRRDGEKTVFMGQLINPPIDKLVVQVRRDREAYPEVESLMEWAEGVVFISCSNLNPFTVLLGNAASIVNPIPFSSLVDNLTKEGLKQVIASAKRLGYGIQGLSTVRIGGEMKLVAVRERYVKNSVMDFQLSSGMMRVLYILCFLEYLKSTVNHSLLLIDDLGEGLDYNRAALLGRRVFADCANEELQMIASSNDSFMMDVVDISNWQIVRRNNSKVEVINQANTPKLFEAFRMTGLSNFDFFSSDFIDNYLARTAE